MPEYKTPQPIVDLLRPLPEQASADRRVWSIPLNMVWVPFFTATNVQGQTAISHEGLGAPLRLGKAKDGSVRFGANGKPVLQVNKELSTHVKTVRDNFTASLVDYARRTAKARPDDYKAQVEAAMKAGVPIVEADLGALNAALQAQVEAKAKADLIAEALAQATLQGGKEGMVLIEVGAQSGRFKTVDPEDFPPFPSIEPKHEAVVDGDALVRALRAAAPFAATEESRPVLTGLCLELGDKPKVVAADGFRLAWEELPGKLPGEGNILIPAAHASLLGHFWHKARGGAGAPEGGLGSLALVQRSIRLGWTTKLLRLNWGGVTMFTSLIEGTFPNWPLLVPKDFQSHVTFLAEDLHRSLRGMGFMAREGSGIIRLEWDDGRLKVCARGDETGDIAMQVPATIEGPGRIAFNCRYLVEYLNGKQGMVKLSTSRESSPGVFTYHGRANHVLMPMHVQWDTPSPFPQPEATPEASTETPPTSSGQAPEDKEVDNVPEATETEAPLGQVDIPLDIAPTPAETPTKPRRGRKVKAEQPAA